MRGNLLEPMEKSRFFQLVGNFEGLPSILLNINFRVGPEVRQEDMGHDHMAKQNNREGTFALRTRSSANASMNERKGGRKKPGSDHAGGNYDDVFASPFPVGAALDDSGFHIPGSAFYVDGGSPAPAFDTGAAP